MAAIHPRGFLYSVERTVTLTTPLETNSTTPSVARTTGLGMRDEPVWGVAGDPLGMQMRRLVAACNATRWDNAALRADSLKVPHEDPANQVVAFARELDGNVVLAVVNLSDQNFADHNYGVRTGGYDGQWTQILCTQDAAFGGWDGAGNAFYEPRTQADGQVYINLPKWSVVLLRRK
jgi:1,4-alpha-glucan branching enzyme